MHALSVSRVGNNGCVFALQKLVRLSRSVLAYRRRLMQLSGCLAAPSRLSPLPSKMARKHHRGCRCTRQKITVDETRQYYTVGKKLIFSRVGGAFILHSLPQLLDEADNCRVHAGSTHICTTRYRLPQMRFRNRAFPCLHPADSLAGMM